MRQLFIISILSIFATISCSQKSGGTSSSDKGKNPRIADYIKDKGYEKYSVATFAGGCFWCTEASFERINGVVDVMIDFNITGVASYRTVENAVRTATKNKVGGLSQWKHVMMVWSTKASWSGAAYGYVNGRLSCFTPGNQFADH